MFKTYIELNYGVDILRHALHLPDRGYQEETLLTICFPPIGFVKLYDSLLNLEP